MPLITSKTTFRLNVRKGKVIATKDFGKKGGLRASLQRNKRTGGTLVHSFIVDKKDFIRKGNKLIPRTKRGKAQKRSLLSRKTGADALVKRYL